MEITADAAGGSGPQEIPGDPLTLERQVCFALSVAARSVLSVYRPLLEPMGLTHPQYLVMLALWGQSPLAVKELIEMLQLDGPTLSPLLKRLEAAGLVTRTRDPHDERQLRIDLTPRGRALREDALRIPPSVVAKLGMSLGDLEELHKNLTAVNEAARRAGVKPLTAPAADSVLTPVDYQVSVVETATRQTAVVPAATTWQEFPALWGQLLGEVWACLRAGGIDRGCRNIMLYLDGAPTVEVGVLLDRPCPLTGRVIASSLPAGTAAMTVHRGDFGQLDAAHQAVLGWCAARGHHPGPVRWEIYGPHNPDPAEQWTEVYWQLS